MRLRDSDVSSSLSILESPILWCLPLWDSSRISFHVLHFVLPSRDTPASLYDDIGQWDPPIHCQAPLTPISQIWLP